VLRAALLILLAFAAGCSSRSPSLAPDPLPQLEPVLDLGIVWVRPTEPSVAGGGALSADPGSLCLLESGGNIRVINPGDGSEEASTPAGRPLSGDPVCSGSYRALVDFENNLVMLDADAEVLWETSLSGSRNGSPVFLPEQDLLVIQDESGKLSAYGAQTGVERWAFSVPEGSLRIDADAGLVRAGEVVLAGFRNGKLYAIDTRTGLDLWESTIAIPDGTYEFSRLVHVNPPSRSGAIACATSYQGNISCIELTNGRQIWSKAFSSTKSPLAADGAVFALDERDVIHAFGLTTGEELWENADMKRRGLRLLGASGQAILVGDFEGYVHLIDAATGAALGRSRIASAELISAAETGGDFIVRSADGTLARVTLDGT